VKNRSAFFLVLVVVTAAVVVWFSTRKPAGHPTVEPATAETTQTNEARRTPIASTPVPQRKQTAVSAPTASAQTPESNPGASIEPRRQQMEEERQRGLNEWRAPIEFFGLVVDENTNAVEGVLVDFDCNDLSPSGTSFYHTQSDVNGLFLIQGITGKLLGVKVSKVGYYSYQPHGLNFYYAGQNQNFVPDRANPVIFRLKKKGVAEPLVVFEKTFSISISCKPLQVDLKTGGQEAVIMEFIRRAPENPEDRLYDWIFRMTVPNGGLVLSTNEFDFFAPEREYESLALVEMKASLGDQWQSRMKREYFLKLPDGNFARVALDLMSHNGSLRIQAFVNPSGSRNLEFDPAKQIQ
jgi:hypothetical protein